MFWDTDSETEYWYPDSDPDSAYSNDSDLDSDPESTQVVAINPCNLYPPWQRHPKDALICIMGRRHSGKTTIAREVERDAEAKGTKTHVYDDVIGKVSEWTMMETKLRERECHWNWYKEYQPTSNPLTITVTMTASHIPPLLRSQFDVYILTRMLGIDITLFDELIYNDIRENMQDSMVWGTLCLRRTFDYRVSTFIMSWVPKPVPPLLQLMKGLPHYTALTVRHDGTLGYITSQIPAHQNPFQNPFDEY